MGALAAAGPRPRGGACDLGGGWRQARDRCGWPSPYDEPSVLRLVLRNVQRSGAAGEGLSRILAAADGVRGAGAARPRVAPRDLAFRDAARLERPHAKLPPPGPAHGPLRSLEWRPVGLRTREPGISGGSPQTRHGAVPAPQVQADGGNLRLHAERSSTSGDLVRRRLAPPAEAGLRNPPGGHEPRPDLRRVPTATLRCRHNHLPTALHHQRLHTGPRSATLGVGGARRRIQYRPWRRRNEHTERLYCESRGSGGHTLCSRIRQAQTKAPFGGKTDSKRIRVLGQHVSENKKLTS